MASENLAAKYKRFLTSPSSSLVADKATLHYVTTTSTFSGSTDIIKHINSTKSQLSKKKEEYITAVEGNGLLVVEMDTSIKLITGGGAYLPGLDDNFLSDRIVDLIIVRL